MIARKIFLIIMSRGFTNVLGLVTLTIVARLMGPTPLGIIAYASGIVGIFSLLSSMGFMTTHRKKISEGKDLGKCMGTIISIQFSLIVFWLLLFALYYFYNLISASTNLFAGLEGKVLIIVLFLKIFQDFTTIIRSSFIGQSKIAIASVPLVVSKLVASFAKITVAFLGLGTIMLALSELLAGIVFFTFLLYLVRNFPIKKPDIEDIKEYLYFTIPLATIIPLTLFADNFTIVYIGQFAGAEAVAYYRIPLQITLGFSLIGIALSSALLPSLSSKFSNNQKESANNLVTRTERFVLILLTPIAIILYLFSEDLILLLLGSEFRPSIQIFPFLLAYSFFSAISRPYNTQIIGVGHVKAAMYIGFVVFLIRIISLILFVPDEIFGFKAYGMGAKGAAISILSGSLSNFILSRIYCYFSLSTIQKPRVVGSILLAIFLTISIYQILPILFSNVAVQTFFTISVLIFIYVASVFLLKVLDSKDIFTIRKAMNPFLMGRYIHDEMLGKDE